MGCVHMLAFYKPKVFFRPLVVGDRFPNVDECFEGFDDVYSGMILHHQPSIIKHRDVEMFLKPHLFSFVCHFFSFLS